MGVSNYAMNVEGSSFTCGLRNNPQGRLAIGDYGLSRDAWTTFSKKS
jgi:hypothetical protein